MLVDPKNNWKYAFDPLKVVGLRGERDFTIVYLEGGGSITVTDMGFTELFKLINDAQKQLSEPTAATGNGSEGRD